MHPDKAVAQSTAAFQELGNAYERVLKYLVHLNKTDEEENPEPNDENFAERFTKDNFENFNFPTENNGSF